MADTEINELNSGFPSVDRSRLAAELGDAAHDAVFPRDPLVDVVQQLTYLNCALAGGHYLRPADSPFDPAECYHCGYVRVTG